MQEFDANEKNYSGIIKLRIPKSFHKSLVEKAKEEGVSLNQYCICVLTEGIFKNDFSAKKLNEALRKIRDKNLASNRKEIISQVKDLDVYVQGLKPKIKEEIKKILFSKDKRISLSQNEVLDLEYKYPLIDGKFVNSNYPSIKRPNVKMILEMDREYIDYFKLKNKLKEIFADKVLLSVGSSDDIAEVFDIESFKYNNLSIYVQSLNLDEVDDIYEEIEKILKNEHELEKVLKYRYKIEDIRGKISIQYVPTYLIERIDEEFRIK